MNRIRLFREMIGKASGFLVCCTLRAGEAGEAKGQILTGQENLEFMR